MIPQGTVGSNPTLSATSAYFLFGDIPKFGRRGAPAKGVGRVTGARVQISPSPPKALNIIRAFIINKYRRKNYEKVLGFADVRCNVSRLDSL